jgi:hypothetical protein
MRLVKRTITREERTQRLQQGAVGWILLWVIGIPIPLLLIFFLLRGCT